MSQDPRLTEALRLADAYASACFDQALNQRTEDPAPEAARQKLVAELESLLDSDDDDQEFCPACGAENGGTSCGLPDCGLVTG